MYRFAFFDAKPYDKPAFDKYGEMYGIEFKYFDTRLYEDTAELASGFDGVVVFVNDNLSSAVIDKLEVDGIKLIALRCAGYNNVDVRSACGRIRITRVPAYSPNTVAEHTMAMILTSVRRIHKAYIRTRDFNFSLNGMTGFELHGKTVGVVGTGKIGRAFIDICRGFGMNVLAYDLYPAAGSGINYVSLDEIFKNSDIISLHCPLTKDTVRMINSESISLMKKGVMIVNTSRGALIDAEDLLESIKSRKVGAACLDVYEEESDIFFEDKSGHIMQDDVLARLLSMPNVLVTSHQAFLTVEALDSIAKTTTENIISYLNDGICQNEVTCKQV